MTVKLLTEHHLEFQSTTCQTATLLEISCHGPYGNIISIPSHTYDQRLIFPLFFFLSKIATIESKKSNIKMHILYAERDEVLGLRKLFL